ncbi:hypothetical protein BT69DRAFT_213316 [Atractiella rhizophila]|nr:hypothetical protein BT69DRAFT_213316 [Atractiella rhizophila]
MASSNPILRSESLPAFPLTPRPSRSPSPVPSRLQQQPHESPDPESPTSLETSPLVDEKELELKKEDDDGVGLEGADEEVEMVEGKGTLWDHLMAQVWDQEPLEGGSGRRERVDNFLKVPLMVEKIIAVGFLICLDAFLYNLTILPLRVLGAFYTLFTKGRMSASQLTHVSHLLLLIIPSALLVHFSFSDPSRMYHSVRGQETIKLYVIYNCMEIADRLFCSFGLDLLDSLASFFPSSSSKGTKERQPIFRPTFFFLLSQIYVFTHTLILLYLLVSLNVSINSYSNALLTLLLSNQFVEIKGAVFKKFETENLFQLSCAGSSLSHLLRSHEI